MNSPGSGQLIIIGSGIAGVSAATAARRVWPHSNITILSSDRHGFYNRIALNSLFTGKRELRQMRFHPDTWLDRQRILLRTGIFVNQIDPERREVHLDTQERATFDRLILATGATPAIPPMEGNTTRGVYPLWTLSDAQKIQGALVNKFAVTILGGGILGVEAALDLAATGRSVTLIELQPGLLPMQLMPDMGSLLRRRLEQLGISVRTATQINAIRKALSRLTISMTPDTEISSDLLLICTGVRPEVRIAADCGIRVANGIVVDSRMQTSIPGILACGNCVSLDGHSDLLWTPAMAQGITAGQNAFGEQTAFRQETFPVHLKNATLPVFSIGSPPDRLTGKTVIEQDGITDQDRWVRRLVLDRDRRIRHAAFLGDTHGCSVIENAVRKGYPVPESRISPNNVDGIVQYFSPPGQSNPMSPGWVCRMCGFVHEGYEPPDICRICGVGKDQFQAA